MQALKVSDSFVMRFEKKFYVNTDFRCMKTVVDY